MTIIAIFMLFIGVLLVIQAIASFHLYSNLPEDYVVLKTKKEDEDSVFNDENRAFPKGPDDDRAFPPLDSDERGLPEPPSDYPDNSRSYDDSHRFDRSSEFPPAPPAPASAFPSHPGELEMRNFDPNNPRNFPADPSRSPAGDYHAPRPHDASYQPEFLTYPRNPS
jgi:hypothetical protein